MPALRVGADELWYDDTGGAGVPLVLLHPGITDSRVWDGVLPLLGDARVIRYDRRGFGRSARPTENFVPVEDLVALLDGLDVDRAHLVGNSRGGAISLALAVTAPERVASLTLLCPGIDGYPWPDDDPPNLVAEWERCVAEKDVDGMTAIFASVWCASGVDDYLLEQLRSSAEFDFSPEAKSEGKDPAQWEASGALDLPATVIAGALDPADSLQASIDLATRIPGAELVRLDADHLPQYRQPDQVAAAILRTVARS